MVWRVGLVGRSWAGRKSSVLREEEEECHFSTTRPALLVKNFKKIKKELKKTKKIIFFIGT